MISTDKDKIKNLLERGVENIFVKETLEKKLLSGKKLKVYLGIDPTGPTLHMGHIIPMMKLQEFQNLGHQVILLMGDFTAMIGDPTDKGATRVQLTHKQVMTNLKNYKKQASKFLKFTGTNPAEFKFNSKWLAKMNFQEVLELASKTTIDQMLKRDMFAKRQEEGKPILGHEFFYPLMQGYDSVMMGVDVEIGGNDQTFNMLVGRDLVSLILKKDKSVIAMKLLVDNTGKKMGKTEGNMISFLDSAEEMFGKVMSWNDALILKGFELCTNIPTSLIKDFENKMSSGANPRDIKMRLAYEIVKLYHGEKKAKEAEDNFVNIFQKREIPEEMTEVKIHKGEKLMDALVREKIISSKGEFRRLVEERAVTNLDTDNKLEDVNLIATSGMRLKIGKKRFVQTI